MKNLAKAWSRKAAVAALFVSAVAAASAQQTANTVVAKFGSAPSAGSSFKINLINDGPAKTIAGFAFKLKYDPSQVSITGVKDNTGQSSAKVQYTLGKESAPGADGLVERSLTATTLKNLENAGNLAEISVAKKAGFAAPLKFEVTDRASQPVIDGLTGGDMQNIPHNFNTSQVNQ